MHVSQQIFGYLLSCFAWVAGRAHHAISCLRLEERVEAGAKDEISGGMFELKIVFSLPPPSRYIEMTLSMMLLSKYVVFCHHYAVMHVGLLPNTYLFRILIDYERLIISKSGRIETRRVAERCLCGKDSLGVPR